MMDTPMHPALAIIKDVTIDRIAIDGKVLRFDPVEVKAGECLWFEEPNICNVSGTKHSGVWEG